MLGIAEHNANGTSSGNLSDGFPKLGILNGSSAKERSPLLLSTARGDQAPPLLRAPVFYGTSTQWLIALSQLLFGFMCACGQCIAARCGSPRKTDEATRMEVIIQHTTVVMERLHLEGSREHEETEQHETWQKKRRDAFEGGNSIFCSHQRKEENFIRDALDAKFSRPPGSPLEIESHYFTRSMLYRYLVSAHMVHTVSLCFGWSMVSGGIGSVLALQDQRTDPDTALWIRTTGDHIARLLSDFKWFPIFMLAGQITFFVGRWRGFMFAAWGVEGRLKDMCMCIGSQVIDGSNAESRKLMYKIYRYAVLAMAVQYKKIIPQLSKMHDNPEGFDKEGLLTELGLVTKEEAALLYPTGSRMRDVVLSWIALEVERNGPDGTHLLTGRSTPYTMEMIAKCRGKMMYFWGNNFYPQPNTYAALMKFVIDAFCMIVIVSYPFKMLVPYSMQEASAYTLSWNTCLQPITIICVFVMLLSFWGMDALAYHLHAPFDTAIDTFNIDALISGTEETLFTYLRASFDHV